MMAKLAVYVVDRLEGRFAVLVDDDGAEDVLVERKTFPFEVEEGMVLRVPVAEGRADWRLAEADEAERERRLEDERARMNRLRSRDPGGDLEL